MTLTQEQLQSIADNPKAFLSRSLKANELITAKRERVEDWRRLAESITVTLSDMPRGGSGPSKIVESSACNIVDLEREIIVEIEKLMRIQQETAHVITELLTDERYKAVVELRYLNGQSWRAKGEKGQHAFMVLETETVGNKTDFAEEEKPKITIHNLASMLQKDELFQDYLENNRRKVQSAFQLPDLYVGYTTDFNRATAQTAQEITEKQVFQPERKSLAWAINNKLLNGYALKYVEAYFLEPDITNPDDLAKILNITERAGGLTPNKAKELTYSIMGEAAENYDGEWGDIPLAYSKTQIPAVTTQLDSQIKKAASDVDNDAVVAVMKEVRALLLKMEATP